MVASQGHAYTFVWPIPIRVAIIKPEHIIVPCPVWTRSNINYVSSAREILHIILHLVVTVDEARTSGGYSFDKEVLRMKFNTKGPWRITYSNEEFK